jgi:hypothetical protein
MIVLLWALLGGYGFVAIFGHTYFMCEGSVSYYTWAFKQTNPDMILERIMMKYFAPLYYLFIRHVMKHSCIE